MQKIEFTSNELYFLLNYMRDINKEVNNKYSNSILKKVERAFLVEGSRIREDHRTNFQQEYECEWIGEK